jgi:hypothetical protein
MPPVNNLLIKLERHWRMADKNKLILDFDETPDKTNFSLFW